MVRLGALLRRSRDKAEEKPEDESPAHPVFEGPPIVVMIPDVAGVSSFRVSSFPHAEAAVQYVTSLSRQQQERAHAFWALQEAPEDSLDGEDTAGEAMVLIRSSEGSDLVYVVSFLDIESAQSFARFEVKRGMHLGLILVYWASMVTVVLDGDGVQLIPEFPPRIDMRRQRPAKTIDLRSGLKDTAEAPATDESAPVQPETNGRVAATPTTPSHAREDTAQRKIEAEAEEQRRIEAEAEEQRRIEAEAEEQRRIEAEAEEQRRIEAEAEEQRRIEAEAEEQRRIEAEAEEQRRIEAEAEEQRRIEAEAEERRRIEAEAEVQRRIEAEAEERRLEAEAEEQRRIEAEAEEQRRIEAEAEEQRRIEAEAAEQRRIEAEAEEQRRIEAEEQRKQEAEKEQQRLQEDAERWRLEAEAEERRRIEAETEMRRLREAMEAEQRRIAEEAEDQVAIAAEAERLRFEVERRTIFDGNAKDAVAAADDFPPSAKGEAGPATRPLVANPIEELLREAEWRVRVPNEYAKEALDAPSVPDSSEHDEEAEEIADEVGKILRKRRWARRDSPFDGFKSPPGRF